MNTAIHIAPALTSQAGQCRIYRHQSSPGAKIPAYRDTPSAWSEVGLMNSRGSLVCFDGTSEQRQELIDSQPLSAGIYYTF